MSRRAVVRIGLMVAFTLPAQADELPARKVGLWELTITHEGVRMPPQRLQQCIDAETDRRMRYQWLGADGPECKVQGINRTGGTITVDKTCISGISSRSVITGDFDSAYAVQVTSSHHVPAGGSIMIETPGGMIGRDGPVTVEGQKSSIAAKFLGDCKVWMFTGRTYFWNGSDFVGQ